MPVPQETSGDRQRRESYFTDWDSNSPDKAMAASGKAAAGAASAGGEFREFGYQQHTDQGVDDDDQGAGRQEARVEDDTAATASIVAASDGGVSDTTAETPTSLATGNANNKRGGVQTSLRDFTTGVSGGNRSKTNQRVVVPAGAVTATPTGAQVAPAATAPAATISSAEYWKGRQAGSGNAANATNDVPLASARQPLTAPSPLSGDPVDLDEAADGRPFPQGQAQATSPVLSDEGASLRSLPPHRPVLFVTMTMFSGYAATVMLQSKLKAELGVPERPEDELFQLFTAAVSCQYIGNLLFRLGHNFFICLNSRRRVFLAQGAMAVAMLLIVSVYLANDIARLLHLGGEGYFSTKGKIYMSIVAYLLAGLGIGSFESNLVASITPLGPATKVWAIVGLPVGFNVISVLGFALMSTGVPPVYLYLYVFVGLCFATVIYARMPIGSEAESQQSSSQGAVAADVAVAAVEAGRSPQQAPEAPQAPVHQQGSLGELSNSVRNCGEWLFSVLPFCIALLLDMFCVALVPATTLSMFTSPKVPLLSDDADPKKAWLVDRDVYFAFQNTFIFLGDTVSRKIAYVGEFRRLNGSKYSRLCVFVLCNFLGLLCIKQRCGLLVSLGSFLVFFANGSIYASTTRFVDAKLGKSFHITVLSVWLFLGDVGSVAGSMFVGGMRKWVCPDGPDAPIYHHVCRETSAAAVSASASGVSAASVVGVHGAADGGLGGSWGWSGGSPSTGAGLLGPLGSALGSESQFLQEGQDVILG